MSHDWKGDQVYGEFWDVWFLLCVYELISDVLPWTPSHRRTSIRRSFKTNLQQFCTDTGYSLEDLPNRWTIKTNGEIERESLSLVSPLSLSLSLLPRFSFLFSSSCGQPVNPARKQFITKAINQRP